MNEEKGNPITILLIEDNPGDVRLIKEALKECKVLNRMKTVRRKYENRMICVVGFLFPFLGLAEGEFL